MFSFDLNLENGVYEYIEGEKPSILTDCFKELGFKEKIVAKGFTIKDFVLSERAENEVITKEEVEFLESIKDVEFSILFSDHLAIGIFFLKHEVISELTLLILQVILEKILKQSTMLIFSTPQWSQVVLGLYYNEISRDLILATKIMDDITFAEFLSYVYIVISIQDNDFIEQIFEYIRKSYFNTLEHKYIRYENSFLKVDDTNLNQLVGHEIKPEILISDPPELIDQREAFNQTLFIVEKTLEKDWVLEAMNNETLNEYIETDKADESVEADESDESDLADLADLAEETHKTDDIDDLINKGYLDFDNPLDLLDFV